MYLLDKVDGVDCEKSWMGCLPSFELVEDIVNFLDCLMACA